METTKLSSKGQIIISKPFLTAHHWEAGQELIVIDTVEGILLKLKIPFQETKEWARNNLSNWRRVFVQLQGVQT